MQSRRVVPSTIEKCQALCASLGHSPHSVFIRRDCGWDLVSPFTTVGCAVRDEDKGQRKSPTLLLLCTHFCNLGLCDAQRVAPCRYHPADVQSPLDLTHTNAGRSAKLCLSLASAGMQVFVNVVVSVQYQVGTEPSHASLLCCFLAAMSPEDICTPVMPPAPHWSACR